MNFEELSNLNCGCGLNFIISNSWFDQLIQGGEYTYGCMHMSFFRQIKKIENASQDASGRVTQWLMTDKTDDRMTLLTQTDGLMTPTQRYYSWLQAFCVALCLSLHRSLPINTISTELQFATFSIFLPANATVKTYLLALLSSDLHPVPMHTTPPPHRKRTDNTWDQNGAGQ